MMKTLIWSVVLYCSETWTMRKADIRRLEAFEMWTWRKSAGRNIEQNEEVMGRIEEERTLGLIHTIRKRQRKWIGHTLSGDSLLRMLRMAIEGEMEGRRTRGR